MGNWSDPFRQPKVKKERGPVPRYQGPHKALSAPTTAFLAKSKVTASTKLVWLYLGTLGTGEMVVNIHGISRWLGMSRSTVWRALLSLQAEGMIAWDRKGKGGSGWDRHGYVRIVTSRTR